MAVLKVLFLFLSVRVFAAEPFIVHEWGTFTSFQQSQGYSLYGLQRGDEPLPKFVYLRNPDFSEPSHDIGGCQRNSYSCDWAPNYLAEPVAEYRLGVNQRMETPVIYFHSDIEREVNVKIDFPNGLITEWYPKASSYQPAIGHVENIADGSMSWDVKLHTERLPLPSVPTGSIWAPSRAVKANDISVGSENERLIFYRGVGDFKTAFQAGNRSDAFLLENRDQNQEIPELIYLRVTESGAYARSLGRLSGSRIISYSETATAKLWPMHEYQKEASAMVHRALVNAGLFEDEAHAMVNTWKHAYFETLGERFLYVLPRAWTDELLPMKVVPAPDRLERVLVGRVEVMNHHDSRKLFEKLFAAAQEGPLFTSGMGVFAEQHLTLAQGMLLAMKEEAMGKVSEKFRGKIAEQFQRAKSALDNAIVEIQRY